jgi:hypothetical protein
MSARDLIHRAEAAGVLILADNGNLVLRGETSAVNALVHEVKVHKAEIIAFLGKPIHRGLPKDLERRIEFVAQFHGFTPEELAEAKEIAAGDIENAIPCFRRLYADILAMAQQGRTDETARNARLLLETEPRTKRQ